MKFLSRFSDNSQGIIYNIMACLSASIMVAIVHYLSKDFHVFFIVMVRNFFGLLFFAPQIWQDHRQVFRTNHFKLHFFRGINGLIGMFAWFYAVSILPLAEVTAISFIAPIFTTIIAIFFFKEKVKSHVWMATMLGFCGVVVILRPGFRELNDAYFVAIFAVSLWSITNALIKTLAKKQEKPQTVVAYMSLIMLIFSIPFALPHLHALDLKSLLLFILLGLFSNLTHTYILLSFSKAELSLLQPIDFMRLIFTTIIAYFVFDEIIDFWTIIGSIVILSGVILTTPQGQAIKIKWKKPVRIL